MRILILNSSPDTCEMLADYFAGQGWQALTGPVKPLRTGDMTSEALMATYRPDAIVLDIAIPYEANWSVGQRLRDDPHITCPVVVTTTNERVVRHLVGVDEPIQEVVGEPYDLDRLHQTVLGAVMGSRAPEVRPSADRRGTERRVRDRRESS